MLRTNDGFLAAWAYVFALISKLRLRHQLQLTAALAVSWGSQPLWSQGNGPGAPPFSTQSTSTYDSINLSNNRVQINLPIRSKQGNFPITVYFGGSTDFSESQSVNSGNWINAGAYWLLPHVAGAFIGANVSFAAQANSCLGSNNSSVQYSLYQNVTVNDSGGAIHPTNFPGGSNYPIECPLTDGNPRVMPALHTTYSTTDGSGYTLVLSSIATLGGISFDVYDRAGNHIQAESSVSPDGISTGVFSSYDSSSCKTVHTVVDALQVPVISLSGVPTSSTYTCGTVPAGYTFSYLDQNGTVQTGSLTYSAQTIRTIFGCRYPQDFTGNSYAPPVFLPSALILADGSQYTFTYEKVFEQDGATTGRLARLGLPDGGSISYEYHGGNAGIYCDTGWTPTLTRTVSDAKGHSSSWLYTIDYDGTDFFNPPKSSTTTVADPMGNVSVYSFGYGYETMKRDYQGAIADGILLKTSRTCYNGSYVNCGQPASVALGAGIILQKDVYTSYNGASPSLVETTFNSVGLQTEVKQYDFGAAMPPTGIPLTDTVTTYGSWNGSGCSSIQGYIQDRVCEVSISGTLGNSSDVRYTYNNAGHASSVAFYVSSTKSWLSTSANYATSGALLFAIDGNGYKTTYSQFMCNSLLPTSISSGGLTTSLTWDCAGGMVTSLQDVNGQLRRFYNADQLWRPSSMTAPDGGVTTYLYPNRTQMQQITVLGPATSLCPSSSYSQGNCALVQEYQSDGLGREVSFQKLSDPDGVTILDTEYDLTGRTSSVSNPYRGTGSKGVTTFAYDALGRLTRQCQPDNGNNSPCLPGSAYQQWDYSGQSVIHRNENGAITTLTMNALGQIVGVVEPGSLRTTYSYDSLGNLNCVDQWGTTTPGNACGSGRARSFAYDSLSHLIVATNPETGAICYGVWSGSNCVGGYDANGNLLFKTDARGVVTVFSYDNLNRLSSKTYLHDPSGTPSACYQYGAIGAGGNRVGRLVDAWTQVGACPTAPPATNVLTRRTILSYDAVGRLLTEQQCARSTCGGTVVHSPQYTYDLAGNAITYSNGLGTITFVNCVGGANRVLFVSSGTTPCSNGTGLSSTSVFGSAAYSPSGLLNSAVLGVGLQLNRDYDLRQRINSETANGLIIPSPLPAAATVTITGAVQTR